MKDYIIHTNEIDAAFGSYDAAEEAAREALLEEHEEEEISDDMIWRWLSDVMEEDCSDFWRLVQRVTEGPWLVIANVGTWMGRRNGGRVFDNLHQALSAICDNMDFTTITEDAHGGVHAVCIHHDGRNHYDLYRLSPRGEAWYKRHSGLLDRRTLCETLAKPHNRRAPHLRRMLGEAA